jgi:hypothetical protein
MFYRLCLVLVLGLATAWAQPTIPETPAGRTFKAWLEAFNNGDRGLLDAYYRKYEPGKSADSMMPFRNATGGFELLEIVKSERLHLEVLVKERRSETKAFGKLDVKDAEPAEVTSSRQPSQDREEIGLEGIWQSSNQRQTKPSLQIHLVPSRTSASYTTAPRAGSVADRERTFRYSTLRRYAST